MTPEERFTKIENLLHALTESQVRAEALTEIRYEQAQERQTKADAEMAELRQLNKASNESLDRHIEFVAAAIAKTAAAQGLTEKRLQDLISTVDDVHGRVSKLETDKRP